MREKMEKKATSRTTRLVSVPGGLFAVLLVGAVAFGSSVADAARDADQPDADAPMAAAVDAYDGMEAQPRQAHQPKDEPAGEEPKDEPALEEQPKHEPPAEDEPKEAPPAEEPKDKPAEEQPREQPNDDPKDKPAEEQSYGHIGLEAWSKPAYAKLAWQKYTGDGFAAYKVVRSVNGVLSLPLGGDDQLMATVADRSGNLFADTPPCGRNWHYAVFVLGEGGAVLALSNVAAVTVPCPEEKPPKDEPPKEDEPALDPAHMGFEATLVDGKVHLSWEQCGSENFAAYKVVRSKLHANPTFPVNDGTEKVAGFESHEVTSWIDANVKPGETWTYRVYALAHTDHGWVVIGVTDALTVEVGG